MTTTDTTAPDTSGQDPGVDDAPIVGRRKQRAPRVSFTLCSYDPQERETLHRLTARASVDTSTTFAIVGNATDEQKLAAMQNFLLRALVDDNGVPVQVEPVRVRPADDQVQPEPDVDGPELGSALVLVDEDQDLSLAELADVQWRIPAWDEQHDDQDFPSRSLAEQYAKANASSLRRFAALMDDPYETVELDALEEIIDRIMTAAADRPTKRSGASRNLRRTPAR